MKVSPLLFFILQIFFFTGCTNNFKHTLNFDTQEPLRVAVLPFAVEDMNGQIIELDGNLLVDNLSLISSKLDQMPNDFVRELVIRDLSNSQLDIIPPKVVENALHHHGFSQKNILDMKRIYALSPSQLGDLLDCDAVMFGRIKEWSRGYYALQTVATIRFELQLVSTTSAKILFSSLAEDSESRGLTKGPTGWTSLVIEPVKGLDNEIVADLARRMVSQAIDPLKVAKRTAVLETIPPSVFASSHDAHSGVILRNGHLTVVALGTSKRHASFTIGKALVTIPMSEGDAGHYIGEYYPLPSDKFENQPITVKIVDDFGRMATQIIGFGNVSLR